MKVNGRIPSGPNVVTVVIPRAEQDPWVFRAQAVLDFSRFDALVPIPEPPRTRAPGKPWVEDTDDAEYQKALEMRGDLRWLWTILRSLSATEGLEWETVKDDDPSTWAGWEKELRAAGFSWMECIRITNAVLEANCLDNDKVEEARKSFFASRSQVQPAD